MRRTSLTIAALVISCVAPRIASAQAPAPGKQVEQELRLDNGQVVPYLLYLPDDYDAKPGKWPMIFFLHGRGESYGPLSLVTKWGPPRMAARGDKLAYIVVSPQCPGEEQWKDDRQQAALVQLLDHIEATYKVDADRVYLTGLSMGGSGTWRLAADHPERFAAAVPICGRGDPARAEQLKRLPIWVFHGDQDPQPIAQVAQLVEAVRRAGNENIRFTSLEGVGHNSWSAAYATPDVYAWLDKQSASKNREEGSR